jgi:tetratricopeptide (TPR) repeat protein
MKTRSWKATLCCGLAWTLSSAGLFDGSFALAQQPDVENAQAIAQREREREDNRSRSSRGRGPETRDARGSQSSRDRSVPGTARRGGIHAPAIGRSSQPADRVRQQPTINRTPSFSGPRVDTRPSRDTRSGSGNRAGVTTRPGVTVRSGVSTLPAVRTRPETRTLPETRVRSQPGVRVESRQSQDRRFDERQGTLRMNEQGLRGSTRLGSWTQRSGDRRSRFNDRTFTGNTFNYGSRDFRLGHSSYRPSYHRHSGYHGYWNWNRGFGFGYPYYGNQFGYGFGNQFGYGFGNQFGYRPFGWGLGGWGLGSLIYGSGYLGYSNPYFLAGGTTIYNYAQPIPVSYATSTVVANDATTAEEMLSDAVVAFQRNDYDAALDLTNQGITAYPDDAVLHEFRALVLFAKQDYQQAAATIHSVLAVGPGWDWTTLSSLYTDVAIYTEQLRALEASSRTNPQDAPSRFLLAYHYLSCGHSDAAARQLQQVVQLMPNDRVAADVLKMISPDQSRAQTAVAPQPIVESERPAESRVNPAALVGTWKATRPDGSRFELTLNNDDRFSWSFAPQNQKAQGFDGSYTVEGNVLALEREDGGSLIAEVTPGDRRSFNFKLLGAPEDDPGLDFNR